MPPYLFINNSGKIREFAQWMQRKHQVMPPGQTGFVQLTLCILKPHVCAAPHIKRDIQRKILNTGFYIIKTKNATISDSEAHELYAEHKEKFFFNRLVTFMCSGPCVFHILGKYNAIEDWRGLLGPTKVYKTQFTHPQSVRGLYGLSDTRNAAHASDSLDSAQREIKVFFPDFDTTNWLSKWGRNMENRRLK